MDGAHAASSEEMAAAMSRAESVACKGLQQCIETVIAEVCDSEYLFCCIGVAKYLIGHSYQVFYFFYSFHLSRKTKHFV